MTTIKNLVFWFKRLISRRYINLSELNTIQEMGFKPYFNPSNKYGGLN
jgi:hypothetical protein